MRCFRSRGSTLSSCNDVFWFVFGLLNESKPERRHCGNDNSPDQFKPTSKYYVLVINRFQLFPIPIFRCGFLNAGFVGSTLDTIGPRDNPEFVFLGLHDTADACWPLLPQVRTQALAVRRHDGLLPSHLAHPCGRYQLQLDGGLRHANTQWTCTGFKF